MPTYLHETAHLSSKFHYPIGFPGLSFVVRERLFKTTRVGLDIGETVASALSSGMQPMSMEERSMVLRSPVVFIVLFKRLKQPLAFPLSRFVLSSQIYIYELSLIAGQFIFFNNGLGWRTVQRSKRRLAEFDEGRRNRS